MKLSIVPVVLLTVQVAAFAQSNSKCSDMAKFRSPGVTLEITRAAIVPAGRAPGARGGPAGPALPAHCRIDGMMDRRTGTDGKTYGIRFAIALPENWTGQYLQQGGGGLNGTVAEPIGAQAAGDQPALARGFAVATTDTGHQSSGGGFDGSFMQDQLAALDFAYVANGRVAVLARQIIENYYGRPPAHTYFVGCSTGGREAMLMTQRYPLYFDGVVAGAPAMRTGHSNLATRTVTVNLNRIAPKGQDGRPIAGGAISDSDRKAIIAKLLDVCDARDGVKDGMVFDVTGCNFKPADLQCPAAKMDGCLSREQVDAIQTGFAGPKDSRGNQVYPGFFFDTGITATGGGIPGLLASGNSPLGPPSTATQQDIDAEAARVNSNPTALVGDSWTWINLNTFSSHGGKLIFYHGVSDPWFSAKDTIDYYQRMSTANGGEAKVKDWSRLFLSPGMGHCGGGSAALDSVDFLTAAVNWVEKDSAPASVTATGRAFPGRSRPLCAYPEHAQYNGSGNPEDAANYTCRQ
ncbi:MAG TPA: tannase/feruloyl esterase family alpha/beta hydrolase [Terriglobia bacterium]|nr:tannase/feruloyl esterase family alpha/beta hydrolase [Terriglobia bacterium]